MDLDPGWQHALLAEIRRATADDPRVLAVQAYGSVAADRVDDWSDLDVAVRVEGGAAAEIANSRWLSKFGSVWATDASVSGRRSVVRVVYADGRRLDLSVADVSQSRATPLPALDRLAARTTRVRFTAALAVVRAAREDQLVAAHLALGTVRECLELALVLRERTAGAHSSVPAQAAALMAGSGARPAIFDTLAGAAALYDELAVQVDPSYVADWAGLDALLSRARARTGVDADSPQLTPGDRARPTSPM